jgi:hypothetical protein
MWLPLFLLDGGGSATRLSVEVLHLVYTLLARVSSTTAKV